MKLLFSIAHAKLRLQCHPIAYSLFQQSYSQVRAHRIDGAYYQVRAHGMALIMSLGVSLMAP